MMQFVVYSAQFTFSDVIYFLMQLRVQEGSAKAAAWRASLLTFENKIYPLDESWVLPGMGHDYMVDSNAIKTALALHYNGKMKPWLDLGIPKYKSYWKKFLNKEDQLLSECNVNSQQVMVAV